MLSRMHPLKTLMIISGLCLNHGCQSPLELTTEQCSPVFAYVDQSKTIIDPIASYCTTRQYRFSAEQVGGIDGSVKMMPLAFCDRCVGFTDYGSVAAFWEKVRYQMQHDSEQFINEAGYHE